jgi:hypothetical protein
MSFIAHCFCCSAKFRASEDAIGSSVQCPHCHNFFTVAPPERETPALPWLARSRARGKTRQDPVGETPPVPLSRPAIPEYEHTPLDRTPPASRDIVAKLPKPLTPMAPQAERRSTSPDRKGLHFVGVLALLTASAALLCASVGDLGYLTIPLGCCALLLGLVGALTAWRGAWPARLLAFASVLVSLLILGCALFQPGWLGPHYRPGTEEPDPDQDRPHIIPLAGVEPGSGSLFARKGLPNSPGNATWVDASRAGVQVNDVRLVITSVHIGLVGLREKKEIRRSDQDYLIIRIRLTNVGAARIIRFAGWAGTGARLRDDLGTSYERPSFGTGKTIFGQVHKPVQVFWGGRKAGDILVFSVPPENAQWLYLELPGTPCSVPGPFRFAIPVARVRRS